MKKGVLYLLIATFVIGALLGIGIIILDLWNELTLKVMLTTLTIFGFSVPALCGATLYDKSNEKVFPIITIITSIVSAIFTLLLIWEILEYNYHSGVDLYDWLLELIVLSVSFGHISLLLLIGSEDNTVLMTRNGTIIVSIALDILLTLLIFVEDFEEVVIWQFYAILAILIVLGTIVTPILNKARHNPQVIKKEDTVIEEKSNETKNKIHELDELKKMLDKGYILKEEYDTISNRILKKK